MFPIPLSFWSPGRPSVTPSVGALAFTRAAPIVITGKAIFTSAGALAFTGQAPIVTKGASNVAVTPSVGALAIVGQAPIRTIAGNQSATPSVGSPRFTGNAPVVTVTAPLAFFLDGTFSNSATGSSFTYTVVSAIPAGRLVVISAALRGQATINGASDSKGNSYTVDAATFSGSANVAGGIIRSRLTTGLNPGDTIAVTSTGGAVGGSAAIVGSVANTAVSALDRAAAATGTSATPSVSTAATTHAADIVFGLVTNQNTAINQSSGYTTIASAVVFAASRNRLVAGYKIVAATGVQTYAPNFGGVSDTWVETIAAYKGA